jgi:hypothetical protein
MPRNYSPEIIARYVEEEYLRNGFMINKNGHLEKSYQDIAVHCRTDFWCCSFFKNCGECSLFERRLKYTCDGVPISLEECRT